MPAGTANDNDLAWLTGLGCVLLAGVFLGVFLSRRLATMHDPVEPLDPLKTTEPDSPFLDHVAWLRYDDDRATWKPIARFRSRGEAEDYIDDFRRCHAGVDGVALPDAVKPTFGEPVKRKRKKKKRREGGDDGQCA